MKEAILEALWIRYGDVAAEVPLGRDGLAALISMEGGDYCTRTHLDKLVQRVRAQGGPNTAVPSIRPSRGRTAKFLRDKKEQIAQLPDDGAENQQSLTEEDFEDTGFGPRPQVERDLYVFDEGTNSYKTYIQQAKGWVTTSGEAHRAIIQWYSNWDGAPVSLNGISRRTGLPRNWVIGYLKAHQITHDSAPFSAEEVARRGVEEMAQDALALKFGALATRTEELGARQLHVAAQKWWDFELSVLGRIREWINDNVPEYSIPKLKLTRASRPYTLVTSATDFHWGMRSAQAESGYAYDRKIARERLLATTEDLCIRLPGNPEEIIIAVGSDWFHVDGPGPIAATTRGTPQDVDGTPLEIMLTGCELQREHIDILSQIAPVKVVLMAGNHDRHNAHALLLYLSAAYEKNDRVTVIKEHTMRVYQTVGNTLVCFTHGDTAKVKDLGPIMAKERRKEWGKARHHIALGGHLHHQRVQEIGGIRHYLLPSLASADAWHSASGYVTSQAGLMGLLIDLEDGPVSTIFSPVREE
jgi:predicted phosphodiesterase